MLRRLSGAAAGGLRRSLSSSSAASRPPWALIQLTNLDKSGAPAPGATLHLDAPPFVTDLTVPAHFIHPRPLPDPATGVHGDVPGHVAAVSSDGLLLVRFWESRFQFDVPANGDHRQALASAILNFSFTGMDTNPEVTRFVCNPLSGELYRLPDLDGTKRTFRYRHIGLLTQSQGGYAPADRYAVAEMFTTRGREEEEEEEGFVLRRFLSEMGKWEKMVGLPSPLPAGRRMSIGSAVVPFGDRLWWIDESWGAISVDPLSERPEIRFVELPRGSVLPDLSRFRVFMSELRCYRRMGESEGKMRYIRVSKEKPCVVSSFSLDDGGSSWTLDHEVAFPTIWDDEHEEVPLKEMPAIGAIDPLNSHVVYLVCGNQLLGFDMEKEKITGSSRLAIPSVPILPCVLPTWLESSQIPSAGLEQEDCCEKGDIA